MCASDRFGLKIVLSRERIGARVQPRLRARGLASGASISAMSRNNTRNAFARQPPPARRAARCGDGPGGLLTETATIDARPYVIPREQRIFTHPYDGAAIEGLN